MDAGTIGAVALPLVGVLLGTLGTLTGQYLATRGDLKRHTAELAAAARAERKQSIVDYLASAQRVEQVIDNALHRQVRADSDAVDLVLHNLWLAKKLLELVCSYELASAAHTFTSTLENLARSRPAGLTERQRADRAEFMEAARRELGISGPRLYPIGSARRQPAPGATAPATETGGNSSLPDPR